MKPRQPVLRAAWDAMRSPVLDESRVLLKRNWDSLPPALQSDHQMLGRQGNGCGATIGAMPRCDFACRGCYLGEGANKVPAESVEAIKAQMRAMRPLLGLAGNLQITDGEVTLRPAEEVVELLNYARSLDLIPMLMTHGDTFRRNPGLLEQLVRDGGLRELSIHIDTTQRGRVGEWRRAKTEAELNGLRAEFGAMLRAARESTGMNVRAATTMTITPENIGGVADVVRWLMQNPDDFFMISFQPIAQVGRTEDGLGDSVDVEHLWREIARWHWLKRISAGAPLRGAYWLATKRVTTHSFLFVSHHFMSRAQLETPVGQERVKHCVFHVPVNGELVSMCEVNAMGVRESYYAQITSAATTSSLPLSSVS